MKKRMIIMLIGVAIVFGGVFGFDYVRSYFMGKFFANFQPPPAVINATKATEETWQPSLLAVGSLVAVKGVEVTTQVPGQVTDIYFHSGDHVEKGQPLLQLDARTDIQDLKNYQAQLTLAQLNYNRSAELYQKKAVSKSDLDTNQAQLEEAKALVQKTEVLIDEKKIEAPFAGKIGIRQVNIGQYLTAGTDIVSLQALNPLYVQFYLPEQELSKAKVGQDVTVTVDAFPGEKFAGTVTAIDSKVDTGTRNILIQATIPNDQKQLLPGMFVTVNVLLPVQKNVVTVPQTAISYSLYGDSVYVIKQDGTDKDGKPILKAYREYIKIGERRDNEVAIESGIKAGQEIVTSGQLKLQDGMRVQISKTDFK